MISSSYGNSTWSYSPETVKLGCDLCDLDLWPWPFAWTSLWSLVITPENFMMIRWWEHSQKGVTNRQTDRQTDGWTENTVHRAAWSQLKTRYFICKWHLKYWLNLLMNQSSRWVLICGALDALVVRADPLTACHRVITGSNICLIKVSCQLPGWEDTDWRPGGRETNQLSHTVCCDL